VEINPDAPMKVIHLALSARGGAGIAADRSVVALLQQGIDAELWTADGCAWGPAVRGARQTWWRIWLDRLPIRAYRRRRIFAAWTNNWMPSRLAPRINRAAPALIHLHWIGGGFLSLHELTRFDAPVVWTLHDLWAFTGGCHYPGSCERFLTGCGRCPQLGSRTRADLSRFNFTAKKPRRRGVAAWVSPSAWLASLAARADAEAAARLHIIPNGLSGETFAPRPMDEARRALDLTADSVVMLAGAGDLTESRKGWSLLREAAARLRGTRGLVWVMFGANHDRLAEDWPGEVRWLGTLRGEAEVARACAAADLVLLPSLQDNLPNLALEAQACGCPVVGFDTGGLREIIEPMSTGALAEETSPAGLVAAVRRWMAAAPARAEVVALARARFDREYSLSVHGKRLAALYEALTGRPRQR
jgi:glycosyltransferase involved in cell wall biosynthesis